MSGETRPDAQMRAFWMCASLQPRHTDHSQLKCVKGNSFFNVTRARVHAFHMSSFNLFLNGFWFIVWDICSSFSYSSSSFGSFLIFLRLPRMHVSILSFMPMRALSRIICAFGVVDGFWIWSLLLLIFIALLSVSDVHMRFINTIYTVEPGLHKIFVMSNYVHTKAAHTDRVLNVCTAHCTQAARYI